MTFEQITQKAANALGIPYEKFILDFNQISLIEDGTGQAKSKKIPLDEVNYDIKYEYVNCWYNHKDCPWEGIIFYFPLIIFKNSVEELNNVLSILMLETIDLNNLKEKYLYPNESSVIFSIYINEEIVELHFVKSDLFNS
jgi:hypothetical protein